MDCSRFFSVICFISLLFSCGCGYPEVSPNSYELTKALFSACNRQDDEQLSKVDELIRIQVELGEITASEAKWLTEISDQAHAGDWKAAALEARRLMNDQIVH